MLTGMDPGSGDAFLAECSVDCLSRRPSQGSPRAEQTGNGRRDPVAFRMDARTCTGSLPKNLEKNEATSSSWRCTT